MEKIKILGIAPYQEMEPLMRDIAKSYDNLELYTFTGFYKNAIQFAKAFPDKEFDVIVSRGGTADLVRSLNDTPVVNQSIHPGPAAGDHPGAAMLLPGGGGQLFIYY